MYTSTYDVNTLDHWTQYLRWAAHQREGLPGLVRVWKSCRDSEYYHTISAEAALYLRGYYDGLYDYLTF